MVEINKSEEHRGYNGNKYDMELVLETTSHRKLSELAVVKHAALQRIVHHIDAGAKPVAGDIAITRLEPDCRFVPANLGTIRHIQGVLSDYSSRTYQADKVPENQRYVEPRRVRALEISKEMSVALEALGKFDGLDILPPELTPYYPQQGVSS